MTMGGQFGVQLIGVVAVLLWSGVFTWIIAEAINLVTPLRVDPDAELEGLDLIAHGEKGYDL